MTPERRALNGEAVRESWQGEGRAKRTARINSPEGKERYARAARKADTPELRASRSRNARKQWGANPEFREKFQAAAAKRRREWLKKEPCLRLPHIKYVSPTGETTMVRSKWEKNFCRWLDTAHANWTYEPCRVVVGGCPYTPDFLVESANGGRWYVELHRLDNPRPGDSKIQKMSSASTLFDAPLVLISEAGMEKIRQQLRRHQVVLPSSWVAHFVEEGGLREFEFG